MQPSDYELCNSCLKENHYFYNCIILTSVQFNLAVVCLLGTDVVVFLI